LAGEGKRRFWRGKGALILASLMALSLLASMGGVWAAPTQAPHRQTAPTIPLTPLPPAPLPSDNTSPLLLPAPTWESTSTPSPTRPAPAQMSTSTVTPPTSTPLPTISPTVSTAPPPAGMPVSTSEWECAPLKKTISPPQETRLDLLKPCRILVEVPGGAVSETLPSQLTLRLLTEAPASRPPLQMRSVAFSFNVLSRGGDPLVGFLFNRPYTATVRYNKADLEITDGSPDGLVIAYFNQAAQRWTALDSRVDPDRGLVSARWDQPGWLALMMRTAGSTSESPTTPPGASLASSEAGPIAPPSAARRQETFDPLLNPLPLAIIPIFLAVWLSRSYLAKRRKRPRPASSHEGDVRGN
jgi:hypothetical protein